MAKSKLKTPSEPRVPSLALSTWRAWGPEHEQDYQALLGTLPKSSAIPDFRLARAILERHRKLAPPRKTRATKLERPHSVDQAWEPGSALALRDETWGWSQAVGALRERAFDERDASRAAPLANEMALHPEAPWRLWSCASPIASVLHRTLDERGHREPAIENIGAMSLAAAMGFSGRPVSTWIARVAEICLPEAFVADSCSSDNFFFFPDMANKDASLFPDLPIRKHCSPAYSRALDVMELSARPPAISLALSAMGISGAPERPAEPEALAPALASTFLRTTLSGAGSGLPHGFDRKWPSYFALFSSRDGKFFAQALNLGCSVRDVFDGRMIWEHAVEPYSETGSEGNVAPIDDALLKLLFEAGADFRSTGLSRIWGGRFKNFPDRDATLCEFYDAALDLHRAGAARKLLAPWIARCDARELEACTPSSAAHTHSSSL